MEPQVKLIWCRGSTQRLVTQFMNDTRRSDLVTTVIRKIAHWLPLESASYAETILHNITCVARSELIQPERLLSWIKLISHA